ncbi:hypothetical protein B0O80DRAFT_444219 [Mortierella sp. GBAus27b]|nr:hypothetical protein B0O80DRAFT_444219 [Mortierella sp. GBAus27b]
MMRRIRARQLTTGLVLPLALSSITHVAHAQAPTATGSSTAAPAPTAAGPTPTPSPTSVNLAPTAFMGVASAVGNGAVFYQGGQLNTETLRFSSELISLDVTRPWNVSAPAWTNLTTPGGPTTSYHSATMSKDLSTLYVTAPTGNPHVGFLYMYDVNTRTWSNETAPAAQASTWVTRTEALLLTDPLTGALWYLGGALPGNTETGEIDKYQGGLWSTNIPTTVVPPDSESTLGRFSSGTSHLVGSKIYLFGGFVSNVGMPRSYRTFQSITWVDISTATPTTGTMMTLGLTPQPRQDHCSVLTSSQKVIVFGGYDANTKNTFSDVWVLDLITATWQKLAPLNPRGPRYGHSCDIVGANMIVYGGRSSIGPDGLPREIGYERDMQVYDVMLSSWMSEYVPKKDTTPTSEPPKVAGANPGNSRHSSDDSSLSSAALIGVLLTVVALVCIGIGVIIYKRRQKRIRSREAELEKATYMASLGSDVGQDSDHRHGSRSSSRGRRHPSRDNRPQYASSLASPKSGSTRPLNGGMGSAGNTPGMSYYGLSGIESANSMGRAQDQDTTYVAPPEQSGVQYLMQQLPDGTIAVQPVYLDHQSMPLQHSPNMVYSETSSLGGLLGTSMTSPTSTSSPGASYISPPTLNHTNDNTHSTVVSPLPSTHSSGIDEITPHPDQPTSSRNPFTSPGAN